MLTSAAIFFLWKMKPLLVISAVIQCTDMKILHSKSMILEYKEMPNQSINQSINENQSINSKMFACDDVA